MTELPSWLASLGAIAAAIGTFGGLAGIAAIVKARAEKAKLKSEAEKVDAAVVRDLAGEFARAVTHQ